jgi:bifunctional DNA-binding transcriptional regulator/antitoxin component of YhaV-PrlF toxin-antitoxin module
MVLPKELRDKAHIRAGDKLAIVSWEKGGEICCIYLIKTESLAEQVKDFLGPMMKEMVTRSALLKKSLSVTVWVTMPYRHRLRSSAQEVYVNNWILNETGFVTVTFT